MVKFLKQGVYSITTCNLPTKFNHIDTSFMKHAFDRQLECDFIIIRFTVC